LVLDVGNPATDGRLHDRNFLNGISHTLLPFYELVKACEAASMPCITPDVFLRDTEDFKGKRVLLITHLTNERTAGLIAAGAVPFLLYCQESPVIATRFYITLKKLSKPFLYTMAFSGMRVRAHPQTTFISMCFPIYVHEGADTLPVPIADKKEKIVLVAGNKTAPSWKSALIGLAYRNHTQPIYEKRRRLLGTLARSGDVDIYGRGWENDPNPDIRKAHRGPIGPDEKKAVLATYRYALCFENAAFPGYTTEKIFDAFTAGSVPIYLGDPNIATLVPKDAFIDYRDYANAESLSTYLKNMPKNHYERYLENGQKFLAGPAFTPFSHKTFIENVLNLIRRYESQN